MRFFLLMLSLSVSLPQFSHSAETINLAPVGRWIEGQREVRTLTADFLQTRALKTLRDPLANSGKLWFRAPDAFRWELGDPAKNILLRNGNTVFLIQPRQKKATRFRAFPGGQEANASDLQKQAGMKGLMMMQFPFARSLADFKQQFDVLNLEQTEEQCELTILPKDAQAQKFLKSLRLRFERKTGELNFFEMTTREGSTLRNDFSNVRVNEKIPDSVIDYDLTGYEVVDATK